MRDLLANLSPPLPVALQLLMAAVASAHVVLHKRDVRAAIGWIGLIWLVPRALLNRVVPKTLLSPVLVVLAVPILGEPLTDNVLIGGAITLTGAAMIRVLRPRVPEPPLPS